MMSSRLFQMMLFLSVVLALASRTSAQQPPTSGAGSKPKAAPTVPMSQKESAERKKQLLKVKNVNKWPRKGTLTGQPGQFVVELTVRECTYLGGSVVDWPSCGKTSMKCIGPNGNEMCIDEVK